MKQQLASVVACLWVLAASPVHAQAEGKAENPMAKLPWVVGPAQGKIGEQAVVKFDEKFVFLDEGGTKKFLELTGNLPRDKHFIVAPKDDEWFVVFSFDPVGYVKDDEKIDAAALLKSMQESDRESNEERKRLGLRPIYVDGWAVEPHYDRTHNRLEWGLRLRTDEGGSSVNYATRLLGREGVMKAVLVSDPKSLDKDMPGFKAMLGGFEFNSGRRYAEFREGDNVAAYGLGALVAGGAAAALAKTGAGKAIWKFVIAGLVLFGGAIWAFFKRLAGRGKQN